MSIDTQITFILALRSWFVSSARELFRANISVRMVEEYSAKSICVDLENDYFDATVELWVSGRAEFRLTDLVVAERDFEAGIQMTAHNFRNIYELYAALDALVTSMAPPF